MSQFVRWVIGSQGDDKKTGGDDKKKDENPVEIPPVVEEKKIETPKVEEKVEENLTPDQIRQRRLQKLQAAKSETITTPVKETSKPTETEPKKIPKKKDSSPSSAGKKSFSSSPKVFSKSPSVFKPDLMEVESFSPKSPAHLDGSFLKPDEKIIHVTIANTLQITLQKKKGEEFYLESLSETVEEKFFTEDMVEIALVERLAAGFYSEDPLFYLLQCYKRLDAEISKERNRKDSSFIRISFMEEFRNILLSYFSLILLNDHFFPEKITKGREGPLKFLPFLLAKIESSHELPSEFLDQLIKKSSKYEIENIFTPILVELRTIKKKYTMLDNYQPILHTMIKLTSFHEIVELMVNFPTFISSEHINGNQLENESFLGPFFQLSTYPIECEPVGTYHFRDVHTLSVKQLQDIKTVLRSEITSFQNCLHKIVYNFLSKKDSGKGPIIKWMARVLDGNKGRAMMNNNINTSSTEGFMSNFCSVMLKLSAPIISNDKNLTNIDTSYCLTNDIINWKDETKMSANGETVEKLAKELKPKVYSFATECFFFTYRAIQLGPLKTFNNYRNVLASCKEALALYDQEKKIDPYSEQFKRAENEYMAWVVRRWSCETQLM
jgi:hypothetical protein